MGKKDNRLKLGKRKILKVKGFISTYCKPASKFWKLLANKHVRPSDVSSGNNFKRHWGPFEWS